MKQITHFLEQARCDRPVYITHVRNAFLSAPGADCVLAVTLFDGSVRQIPLRLPAQQASNEAEQAFVRNYLYAEVYNLLSALGGRRLDIFAARCQPLEALLQTLPEVFCLDLPRSQRHGYGGCLNVIERMLDSSGDSAEFVMAFHPLSELERFDTGAQASAARTHKSGVGQTLSPIDGKLLCGIDVGGTDIKLACSVDGTLCYLKEYDWFPALFSDIRALIDPILLLVRLLRARASCQVGGITGETADTLDKAIDTHLPDDEIRQVVERAEAALGERLVRFDAIGLCFPDVVINNKIVGGETLKTRGVRNNPNLEYEAEFKKLTNLDEYLGEFCVPGGIGIINDGPMAAYTAWNELVAEGRPELLAQGRFAHTLGTELGTGWIDENGCIPDIPLEIYNFIIDLGSDVAQQYHPDDLRSSLNFNTGLAGTLQKYMAQNGVFRLAIRASQAKDGALYAQLLRDGYAEERDGGVTIVLEPNDMRKPLLEHLMHLCAEGHPELESTFYEIGQATGIAYCETAHVLAPITHDRILYGRLVKENACFELIKKGAGNITDEMNLSVAGEQSAHSGLMLQLQRHPRFTMAQFAQAVGAIYYGNSQSK